MPPNEPVEKTVSCDFRQLNAVFENHFTPAPCPKIDSDASYAVAFSEITKTTFLGGVFYRLNTWISGGCKTFAASEG